MGSIGELYALEKQIREATPPLSENEIVVLRRKQAAPILDQIKDWLLAEYPKVLPQSPIGKAITYALPLWDKMYAYTLHGHLLIDNNGVEVRLVYLRTASQQAGRGRAALAA